MDRNPFIVDGPVPPDSPMYVERLADAELFKVLVAGELINLVGPDGMGKTSLIQRTVERIGGKPRCVVINLSDFDGANTVEDLYKAFVSTVSDRFQLGHDRTWWDRESLPSWDAVLSKLVAELRRLNEQIILVLDEFEAADRDRFAHLLVSFLSYFRKDLINTRSSLVLSGVRVPVWQEHPNPLRLEHSIVLSDFSLEECSRLGSGFLLQSQVMKEIFEWTKGHPYLTQRACWAVFQAGPSDPNQVAGVLREYFLNPNIIDPNLEYIRQALTSQGEATLRDYQRLMGSSGVINSGVIEYLTGVGLLSTASPVVRNRIYREVFNEKWVATELRRLTTKDDRFDGRDLSTEGFVVAERYRLKRQIGTGRAGNVYLAEDQSVATDNPEFSDVALKIIPAQFLLSGSVPRNETLEHFRTTLGAASRLDHENIVNTISFDFSSDEKYFYVVMEYVLSQNLSRFLGHSGRVKTEQAFQILSQIVDGVAAAHDAGVLHGDLNSFKILVISESDTTDNVLVKVGDFGIAKLMNEAPGLPTTQPPRPGQVGDPLYLAPEQLVPGDTPWDERADIYALGFVAYQLFGGRLPEFRGLSEILSIKQEKSFAPLNVSAEVQRAIMWALEPEPGDRPASVREWFNQLATGIGQTNGPRLRLHGVPGSVVYIDDVAKGQIDPPGEMIIPLTRGPHKVRVEKDNQRFEEEVLLDDRDYLLSAPFPEPARPPQSPQVQATDNFDLPIVNVVLTSPLALEREEAQVIERVVNKVREVVYGRIELFTPQHSLSGAVFVAAIRQSIGSRAFKELYQRAKAESLKIFVFIKREETRVRGIVDPDLLPPNEFEALKNEMLADQVVEFYDSPTDFEGVFFGNLADWVNLEFLPGALTRARGSSSAEAITQLLDNLHQLSAVNKQALKEVRRRQLELTGQYWFYFSCADEDLADERIERFFERLNTEVRQLTGLNQFYVGAFQRATAATALHTEWLPNALTAMQNSRVLVPLYTPNYMKSELCGKIWEFFSLRANLANSEMPFSNVLPVLWSSNDSLPSPLPEAVEKVDYINQEVMPSEFATRGVLELGTRSRQQYEQFVKDFARQLVGLANSRDNPPLESPPSYGQLKNAFAPATEVTTAPPEDTYPPPQTGRWIFVGVSGNSKVAAPYEMIAGELGREIARRGYGLMLYGATARDYHVQQEFADELADNRLFKGSFKAVKERGDQSTLHSTSLVSEELPYVVEFVKQCDALVLLDSRAEPYDFYAIAEEHSKPIFPKADMISRSRYLVERFRDFWSELPLDDDDESGHASVRRLIRRLLDEIDRLWIDPVPPRTQTEAFASVAFVLGDLFFPSAQAIVNPVGIRPHISGQIGERLFEIDKNLEVNLVSQGPLVTGETVVTTPNQSQIGKYVIHTCSDSEKGGQTLTSSASAVRGALRKAELLNIQTIAFPSISTGAAGLIAQSLAPLVLKEVLDHLTEGSHLQTVLFVFKNKADYDSYYESFISLGGLPGFRVLLLEFSQPALMALRIAEGLRIRLGRRRISSSLLLWALYQIPNSATRELLQSCKAETEIEIGFRQRLGITDESVLVNVEPVDVGALPFLTFTSNGDQAFIKAKELAVSQISDRHLLTALLSVPAAHGTEWLAKHTGIDVTELYDIVAIHGNEPGKSIADEIKNRLATEVAVETSAWELSLSSPQAKLNNLRVGERFTLEVRLDPAVIMAGAELPKNLLRIPINSLELTGWIRAPGFQLQLELPFSIKLIEGQPETRSFSFDLRPLWSGSRTIEVEIYPGGRVSNLGPALITNVLTVAAPVALPDIQELIDRRKVPYPQPDVMLYVALEETPDGQQTRLYLTCAALELDREILDPLPLTGRDLAELTANAVESAACANGASGVDAIAAVQAIGAGLFDRLINGKFETYFHQIRELSRITERKWSWLFISDDKAILPWELVNYYGFDQESGLIRYDDFFADQFQISHWVGQRGLRLMNSAPMGELDLIHYGQHPDLLKAWEAALNPEFVITESDAAQMSLLKEGSYCFGLHLLRFTESKQVNQIVAVNEKDQHSSRTEGEAIAGDQKLDLALRRPTVGLSVIREEATNSPGRSWCNTELESNWLIPFMHAGASALYGPRWPVSVESDHVFVQEFYDLMRQGEILGIAFSRARARLRSSFPDRTDWLAYSYFGHPHAEPYWVERAQGFTLFEAVNQPAGQVFLPGRSYRFRASYRSEAPAWYDGRLRIQEGDLSTQEMSVMVMPLIGVEPIFHKLERVEQSNEMQTTFFLKMPQEGTTLPVMVRFQRQTQELRTLFLNLQLGEVE